MSLSPASTRPAPPPALSAFLRGVERRGVVLAELQTGDAGAGDAALVSAMRAFRDEAETAPMAVWPQRFWALLLAQPQLQHRTAVAVPIEATDRLGELGSGPRVALLLRVAAGLSEEDAAAVLGVGLPSYRLALQRALPHHADGRADPLAWNQLREQIHRRIKTLPPDRLVRLGAAREAVLRDGGTATPSEGPAVPTRPHWLMPLLWTLLALCALALAATFGPWNAITGGAGAPRQVRVEPLPDAEAPASRFDTDTALVAHRDFALLADPVGDAATRDLDFHSWLAAQQAAGVERPVPPADIQAPDAVAPSTPGDGSETGEETSDAP